MGRKKSTTEEFIKNAKKIHGDKYDYSKVEYVNSKTKVCIICHEKDFLGNEHGEFWQTPANHMKGHGCNKCDGKGFSMEYYIEKAKKIHNGKYSYNKVNIKKVSEKALITCPIHGDFEQIFENHLNGQGCKKCYGNEKLTTEEFIKKAKEVHGDKFIYDKTTVTGNNKSYVTITCPIHGDFIKKINHHLNGDGCSKCSKKYKYTTNEWISLAKQVHGDKYDYSKVEYVDSKTKVKIICPIHGEFEKLPSAHLNGKQGCPYCKSNYLEDKVYNFLKNEYTIERRYHTKWLKKQELDLFLPDYNIAIECQGIEHFKPVDFFGGVEKFEYVKNLDNNKKKLCDINNVNLIYYSETKEIDYDNYIGIMFNNITDLKKFLYDTTSK